MYDSMQLTPPEEDAFIVAFPKMLPSFVYYWVVFSMNNSSGIFNLS